MKSFLKGTMKVIASSVLDTSTALAGIITGLIAVGTFLGIIEDDIETPNESE